MYITSSITHVDVILKVVHVRVGIGSGKEEGYLVLVDAHRSQL